LSSLESYRLHSKVAEEEKNLVSKSNVVKGSLTHGNIYFMHRYMHHNKFLYKHIHSQHRRLVVPYAYGPLYNHPVEGLILKTIGGALSFLISGMSPRTSIFFFSFDFNFSLPFFVMWYRIIGTYMPCSLEKKKVGGFEARQTKQVKD
ncbi:hypothetical protein CARUB_v10011563mg, partial [Capsella rubella]